MNHTTNYNLNQWDDGDVVRREDFNADNVAIDAALKSVSDASPEIVFGTYTGNGGSSQTIYLGRKPRFVLVDPKNGLRLSTSAAGPFGAMAADGYPAMNGNNPVLEITTTGFRVFSNSSATYPSFTNGSGREYYYFAIF